MKKSLMFLMHLQNRKWRKQMAVILFPTEVGDGSFVWVCLWWTSWLLDNKIARELFMMLWWKNILHQEERQVKDILFYIFQWLRWVNCVRILRYNTLSLGDFRNWSQEFSIPNHTARIPRAKIQQVRSYIRWLAELNRWLFHTKQSKE